MYEYFAFMYIYAFWYLQRSEEGTGSPGSGVVVSHHVGGGCENKIPGLCRAAGTLHCCAGSAACPSPLKRVAHLSSFPLSFFFLAVLEKTSGTVLVNSVTEDDSFPLLLFRWGILRVLLLTTSSAIGACVFTHVVYACAQVCITYENQKTSDVFLCYSPG